MFFTSFFNFICSGDVFFIFLCHIYIYVFIFLCCEPQAYDDSVERMLPSVCMLRRVAICCAVLLGCVGPHVGPRALPAASSVGSPDSSRPRREYVPQLVELSPEVKALLGDGPPKKGRRG